MAVPPEQNNHKAADSAIPDWTTAGSGVGIGTLPFHFSFSILKQGHVNWICLSDMLIRCVRRAEVPCA